MVELPGEAARFLPNAGDAIKAAGEAHRRAAMDGRSGHVQMMAALRAALPSIVAAVRAEERQAAYRDAAAEVHREARWQAEQNLRSADSDIADRGEFIERLTELECVLAARSEASR